MPTQQGSLELLQDPVAQRLLQSVNPARVAYTWTDGTPRVVPIWFHWDGTDIVIASPADAPKVKALQHNPAVALTIDETEGMASKVLLIRGVANVTIVDGVAREYALSAERYLGAEAGKGWSEQAGKLMPQMARIAIRPAWVAVIDFEKRFPNALERAMEAAAA